MRVLVAMSGGVDSSVVAGLMASAGHEVIGATLQLYDQGRSLTRGRTCCAGSDIDDARRAAATLGIAHYVIDAEARFAETVIDRFADAYAAGETPVPCIACNQGVKFTDLLGMARDLGCEAMATGHYVRRVDGPDGAELHRPRDAARDQSWFLAATTRDQLDFLRFPLGDYPDKAAVRAEAARLGLDIADKPDSQDICFVPDGDYAATVGRRRPEALEGGEIVNRDGRVLGHHQGVARYTVGQSKRLGDAALIDGERQAVIEVDAARRRIVIGPRGRAGRDRLHLREMNWLADAPAEEFEVQAQLRASEPPRTAWVRVRNGGQVEVKLPMPVLAAPGQACVLYAGNRVIAGGFITSDATSAAI